MTKTRAKKYRATRSHFPTKPAREVLDAIRRCAPWVKSYNKWTRPYNPRIDDTSQRLIEDTDAAGLRFVGFADELANLRHIGWCTSPDGWCEDVMRGAVWLLPARHGCSQYVYGYVDPWNDDAALIEFEPIEGERGGTGYSAATDQAATDAARCADSMAEHAAEKVRDYEAAESARVRAEELREEAKDMRADLCGTIREVRERIAELLNEATELDENPYSLYY